MASVKIRDGLLTEEEYEPIREFMMGDNIPWYYNPFITYNDENEQSVQFTHVFYSQSRGAISPGFDGLAPILNKLHLHHNIRIKANLQVATPELQEANQHVDFDIPCMTSIYYINTCNGYTHFEDGSKIDCVANRLITFPSHMKHGGTTCTDEKNRVVINFNYIQQPNADS